MPRILLITLMAVFVSLTVTQNPLNAQDEEVRRGLTMNLVSQVKSAADELRDKVQADNELSGRKLRLGKFVSPNLTDSSFELAFEKAFRGELKDLLDEKSQFTLSGTYDLLPGQVQENIGLQVIQFTLIVRNQQRRELQSVTREINDSADIAQISGVTVAPPDSAKLPERNKAVADAATSPQFAVRDRTRIQAPGNSDYAVEIRRLRKGDNTPQPLVPENRNGMAFVELSVEDTFEIVLFCYGRNVDASAEVTIDGLNVLNEFNEDGVQYEGYLVPRAVAGNPGTHLIPGWLKSAKQNQGNVFQFVINELGKGAATARQSRSGRGVIHVQFFEVVPEGQELPARSFGEVGTGKPIDVSYGLKQMQRRETPLANIAIRYTEK
jgi:hypothetical protein